MRISDMRGLSWEEISNRLKAEHPANRLALESTIRDLEKSHGMTSEEMLASDLDTAETSRWRVLLSALDRNKPLSK